MTLKGKRIVITRAAHQYADLADLLIAEGAQPLAYPAIQIAPPKDPGLLDSAITELGDFNWLIFTSANAVQAVSGRLNTQYIPHVAVVGAGTADAVYEHLGVTAEIIPQRSGAEHLLDALLLNDGDRVLLPQAEIASPDLERGLRVRGVNLSVVPAYRIMSGVGGVDLPILITLRAVDAITFTSGSTVDYFMSRYTNEGGTLSDLHALPLVCFSGSAERALIAAGFSAKISVSSHALTALVLGLKDLFHAE